VSREYYDAELAGRDEKGVAAALVELWKKLGDDDKRGGAEKKIKASKLTTKFSFPDNVAAAAVAAAGAAGRGGAGGDRPAGGGDGSATPGYDDLVALRAKYQAVYDYMHVVQGERDLLHQENAKVAKAIAEAEATLAATKAKMAANPGAAAGKAGAKAAPKEAVSTVEEAAPGFGLVQVLVVVLAAFLAGRIL
jgi:hypothetical protein